MFMEEEKPKIQLSPSELIKAIRFGKATDKQNVEHIFYPDMVQTIYGIWNVEVAEGVALSNLQIDKRIQLSNCKIGGLHIDNCTFDKGLVLYNNTIDSIFIYESVFKLDLYIWSTIVRDGILCNRNIFQTEFRLYNCSSDTLFIFSSTPLNNLIIYDLIVRKQFTISRDIKECRIDKLNVETFSMPSVSKDGIFRISDSVFKNINTTQNFTNLGYMQWNNLTHIANAKIEILNSIMGKWDIVNCNFEDIKMIIYSSKITDAFYTNTRFPKKLTVPEKIGDEENEHDILRDGYNQIKTLAYKQNDRKTYLHYQSSELSSYFKSIFLKEKPLTQIQLIAMWLSNNYGTSWGRGVLFVGGLNLFFLMLYFSNLHFDPTHTNVITFCANYIDLLLLSLIKKPDFMVGNRGTIIFGASRIFIAFGIYQTIAAFRKFGKSE
jgi:hypothetical protein